MKKLNVMLAVAVLLIGASLSFAADAKAEAPAKTETTTVAKTAVQSPLLEELECGELPAPLTKVANLNRVYELSCTANDCDDYPQSYNSTCSCSSQLVRERCIRACDKKKGQVLETTCTICPGCPPPPQTCTIQPCNDRVSRSCVPIS